MPRKQKPTEPKKAELEFRDSTIYLDYDSEPEEKKEKKVETAAVVMNKVQRMLARVPTPPVIHFPISYVYVKKHINNIKFCETK